MKKKEEKTIPTFDSANNNDNWLLGLMILTLLGTPKSESKTTINIYTGSDR